MLLLLSAGKLPARNVFERNLVDTVGVYGKQTSAYFKAIADANIFRDNGTPTTRARRVLRARSVQTTRRVPCKPPAQTTAELTPRAPRPPWQ